MTWLAFIAAAVKSLPLILDLISRFKASADARVERGIGHDQAVAEAATVFSAALQTVARVDAESAAAHAAHPKDDGGFDPEFQRRD